MKNDAILSFNDSEWEIFDPVYAVDLRNNYPEIWENASGSKTADYIHELLIEVYENGGIAETPEQVEALELRESWIRRHFEDSSSKSIVAQVKWLAVSYYGEPWQKKTINSEVTRLHQRNSWLQSKGAKQPLRDPKGGLTAAGRKHFKRTEGANLKPGVKGAADTPEKMRRKGSFLTRFFTNPSGPMKDENGKPTRLALSAAAWGEPVPQDMEDAAKLAAKGRRLLDRYENSKKKADK